MKDVEYREGDSQGYHIHRPLSLAEINLILEHRYHLKWSREDILIAINLLSTDIHYCGVIELSEDRYLWAFGTGEEGEMVMCTKRINPIEIEQYRELAEDEHWGNSEGYSRLYADAIEVFSFTNKDGSYEQALELALAERRKENERLSAKQRDTKEEIRF